MNDCTTYGPPPAQCQEMPVWVSPPPVDSGLVPTGVPDWVTIVLAVALVAVILGALLFLLSVSAKVEKLIADRAAAMVEKAHWKRIAETEMTKRAAASAALLEKGPDDGLA